METRPESSRQAKHFFSPMSFLILISMGILFSTTVYAASDSQGTASAKSAEPAPAPHEDIRSLGTGPETVQSSSPIAIRDNGQVGIGMDMPQYALDVKGMVRADVFTPSDQRLKKDLSPLRDSLDKVLELRGVTYRWKDPARGEGTQLGMIAQEVERVFPEAVRVDEDGYRSVAYGKLTAPLVEALKAQQRLIEIQSAQIADLENALAAEQKTSLDLSRFVRRLEGRLEQVEINQQLEE